MIEQRFDNYGDASPQSAELFHLIVENIKDYAIFMTDPDGRIVSWNPGVERLLGYSENEIVGQPIAVIFTAEDTAAGAHIEEMERAARTGCAENKRWHKRKDGSLFWAHGMVMPLKNDTDSLRGFAKVMRDDTAHKLAEQNLEQILISINDSFYRFDSDFRFTFVNRATTEMFGISQEEFLGKTLWELFPDVDGNKFHREVQNALGKQEKVVFENYYEPLDRWFENRIYPSADGLSVFTTEITERKRAETALRDSEEQLRALADSIPNLAWMAEADGYIFWYNRRWYDYTGTTPEEMAGWGWQTVHDPELLPNVLTRWQSSILTGEPFEMEIPLKRGADKAFRWFLTRVIPLRDSNGNIVRWFGTNTDIEELRQARLQAEEANRLKDEFLATLSHELRTPLNAILGWSQMLQAHNLGANEAQKALSTIERNARAQSQLIDDLLDVSRIITGKLRLDVRAVDLPNVIAAAADAARPAAEAKNIRLQTLLDPQAGPISGDPDRLQQVIWNLLSNAIKFTPKGGRVQVRLERVNSHVEIVVSDTGKGIEPEFLPHVFDRFRQSDGSMTRRHGGLGLGLAIVRQLVELHGGTVSATSAGSEQGAAFTVNLPLLPVRAEMRRDDDEPRVHPAARTNQAADCPPELSGLRILVVDDESDSRDLLNIVLGSCGARVTTASSASEAFDTLKGERFDIIVSDIGMPEEDGFSLIGRIRNLPHEQGGNVPAIALTAYARAEDRVQALRSGFQMHIAKPVEPSELVAVVANLAGRMRKPNVNRET